MPAIEDIFSLRIVTVDFYMEKPKPGLDPCFSEFRAKEIKKVPIIRIFGSSKEGKKTCMHVHGIFPYLYIPYDKKDFETIDKAVYSVASSIDKAINISLGQGSSSSIHVFKVQLVKGIPFYGYHKKEHQYLKIYMLNPRFIRRTANLLQNGAILGKIFQPHESHVPYILQFFIDYNLYGMSFLHVPKDILKFRRKNEADVIPYAVKKEQILDCNVAEKQSVSQLEMDIASGFILNRFQLVTKASSHTNPGIESIWHDERVRREKLAKDCEEVVKVPPLEIPVSQERPDVKPTDSDQFYRTGLVNKLQQLEASMNDTINTTIQTSMAAPEKSVKEKKRTFNLQKLIANSVYPDECAQDDVLTNASCIEDHLSNRSIFHASMRFSETPTTANPDQDFLDETVVDEELVLSLTQPDVKNQTLREEDMELLDVMQQLEDRDGENDIDLDSTLAPLSQNLELNTSEAGLDSGLMCDALAVDSGKDVSDNEDINDFSIAMDDMDELLLKLSQNSQPNEPGPSMAQIDGADDILMTPKKNKQRRLPTIPKTPVTPKRCTTVGCGSPRTPKSVAKKYAPLPLIIQSRSLKKNPLAPNDKQMSPMIDKLAKSEHVKVPSEECERDGSYAPLAKSLQSLRKKLALTEMRRQSISTESEPHAANANFTNSKRKKTIDLDKTHITCSLRTARRRGERRLKVYESTDVPDIDSPNTPLKAINSNDVQKQLSVTISPVKTELNGTEMSESPTKEKNTRINAEPSPRVRLSKSPLIKQMIAQKQVENGLKVPRKARRLSLRSNKKIQERRSKRALNKSLAEEGDEGIAHCNSKEEHDKGTEIVCRKLTVRLKRHKLPKTVKPVDSPKTPRPRSGEVSKPCSVAHPDESPDGKSDSETKIQPTSSSKKIKVELKKIKIKDEINTPEKNPIDSPKTPIFSETPDCKGQIRRYSTHVDKFKMANLTTPRTPRRPDDNHDTDVDDDQLVHSFYESSFIVDSPVFSDISVPSPVANAQADQELSPSVDRPVIISADLPRETREEIRQNCKLYNIPEVVNQHPFYGNFADVTHKKEVGHTVLSIPGNTLNDLEEFKSSIPDLQGLSCWRRKFVQALGIQFRNEDQIREYFATGKPVVITPSVLPPTKRDAKVWLKARQILKEKRLEEKAIEEDSPIKIRRQKVVMLMENESGGSGDDMDCSMCSLSLTPLTPVNATSTDGLKMRDSMDQSSSRVEGGSLDHTPLTCQSSSKKPGKSARPLKARVSLSQKLKDICISNAMEKASGEDVLPKDSCASKDNLSKIGEVDGVSASQESLQSSESVTSEMALAELERSSFVKNLQSSQGSLDTSFGLSMATLNNTFGFKVNLENLQQAKADVEHNYLTTLSLELFVPTREDLLPNPQFDAIHCLFYAIDNSIPSSEGQQKTSGIIIVADDASTTKIKFSGMDSNVEIKIVANELEGLCTFLELCGLWDPDIFVGYEIEMSSWGYLMERAKNLDLNIGPLLSRVPSQKMRDFIDEDRDQFTDLDVETKLCGRILLDVWRLMRSEIALTSYTFENVMYHIMHRRCPRHTHKDLTLWFAGPQTRWIVLEYYMERVNGTLELLDQLDLIGRTSEMAKLIGIQFYEVLSRGSQFRVESMMLRIAKPKNLVPLSPSVQQRAHMRAPEYLPLILEPQSRFYPDPVIVLDFQSLYPSMIMAYNYCFSTCLGRVEHLGSSTPFEFGASQLRVSTTLLKKLLHHDLVTISPCGAVYVKREIREGILPRMLSEVLDTRQMVKQSMKLHKSSSALQRILHSRQLGLKLMANVTYGYTAANFSGRMPCVEVGDSVVAKGRETLERAIKLVEANDKWNVKVVYGDTDSLFVLVPGRDRAEAFRIGTEIVELVTQDNPQPVKLKLEKVYQPCILQTKKRYVGYMYETPDQEEPVFEAKGIETVRRDGCPAAAKMLEKCLKILFDSADVSQVKSYVCRQFTKLLSGKANIQDLIFAKEFRGLNGYKPTACVPALELTRKWIQTDPRKIPRRGERVPFIITNGPPGVPLIRLVRSPHDVLADEGLKINAIYYITKAIIPPLNRCFLLIGADLNEWFTNLPRKILFTPALSTANELISTTTSKKSTISQYFSSTNCIIDCGRQTKQGICSNCSLDISKSLPTLQSKISKLERGYHLTKMICQACCGRSNLTHCSSLDCPVLYVLEVKRRDLSQISHIENLIEEHFSNMKCFSNEYSMLL